MKWKLRPKITAKYKKLFSSYPGVVGQLLYNRGIKNKNEAKHFLDEKYCNFYNPHRIYDINNAANIIIKLIKERKKIFIHGDFDVDGICSAAILWDFLYRHVKAHVIPYIPDRFDEGYGMTDKSLENIKKQGGEVVITVDCGIRDDDLIKRWKEKGLEFIVTDHHELKKLKNKIVLPIDSLAIVHPSHPRSTYPFKEISGATVAWKLVSILKEKLKINFDLDSYLDLVALSIICDVMPLSGENRSLVKKGLEIFRNSKRIGLRRLISDAGINIQDLDTYHLGFVIGPRLNAAGRLDHAIDAIKLLVTKSYKLANIISEKLNSLNQRRQVLQENIYRDALSQISQYQINRKMFFVWAEDWAEGVIGIVAGKICEEFHRPVLIATRKKGKFTGSARSIDKFNIINAINLQSDLLDRFGGHPQAAGFTVKAENIEQFRDNLLEIADRELDDKDIEREEMADCRITLKGINWDLLKWILKFSPFGYGNSKPRFVIRNVEVGHVQFVGKDRNHLKIALLNKNTGEYFQAIGFGIGSSFKSLKISDKIDLLFTLENNEWNGNSSLELKIIDLKRINNNG